MKKKTALITGIAGQDGALLAKHLAECGYAVTGTFRRGSVGNLWRIQELGLEGKVDLFEYSIGSSALDFAQLLSQEFEFIFHFAGDSFTSDSLKHPLRTINTNISGVLEVLESVRQVSPESRVFIAGSSEMFGKQEGEVRLVSETSPRNPVNPYGVSHSANLDLVRIFRNSYKVFVSAGILFNHESYMRGTQFLTRKVSQGLAQIKLNKGDPIELGNLDAVRDWGSASEFVLAFHRILEHDVPDDFVVATGTITSVRKILVSACEAAGYVPEFSGAGTNEICVDANSGKLLVRINSNFYREIDSPPLVGDITKIKTEIGWNPNASIHEVIHEMYEADYSRIKVGRL